MKNLENNPFQELYVTDSAAPDDFVRYFSPSLVPHSLQLFREGNVVLKGTQGCGKSMLLKLLQPEIRLAYEKKGVEYPVPAKLRNFIGAGVNLSKSGLLDLGQLLPEQPSASIFEEFTALFADLLNYWLLKDLLNSVRIFAEERRTLGKMVNPFVLDKFAILLSQQDCFFGYLDSCKTIQALERRINERVLHYRMWTARNVDLLQREIIQTKTSIHEPLARTVECLKQAGVISTTTSVFLRIDQLEELWHRTGSQAVFGGHLRRVINRAVGTRDLRISFRIGTRRYGWDEDQEALAMPGGRALEEQRDYFTIDLDQQLRRGEDRSGWLFEKFAADVFRHRISSANETAVSRKSTKNTVKDLHEFFGASPSARETIDRVIVSPPKDMSRLIRLKGEWSREWQRFIQKAYSGGFASKTLSTKYDPLTAALIAAWGLQNGGKRNKPPRKDGRVPRKFPPWTVWWEKERHPIALFQLAARHKQLVFWWGTAKILSLSSSNITLFLSICREVWDQWSRLDQSEETTPPWKTQAVAIFNVSRAWHRNFARQPGRPAGDIRMRFVDEVGNWLRQELLADSSMSYPGGNGFSLRMSEIQSDPELSRLLKEAVGWGDLYEVAHTPKNSREKHTDPRKKFYLNPILSPHFQIPEIHTKEPRYENVQKIISLAKKAGAIVGSNDVSRANLTDPQEELTF